MQSLRVELGERSYDIMVSSGLLVDSGQFIRGVSSARQVLLVSNPTVYALYGAQTRQALTAAGLKVTEALMPDGEEFKNLAEASRILDQAVDCRLDRSSLVVALGGGVVGDLAGFVAAIYQRGIDFVQIPTTLLAQVDSSVGGKVGVNHPQGKNLIGAFHQPRLVLVDDQVLKTLEEREYLSGLGEVVKYGIIYDKAFFTYLEGHAQQIRKQESQCISAMIVTACHIKSEIVTRDEKENGLRAILNLGHTFGHSIESLTRYETYRHGEAVAMGTMAAACLAVHKGLLTVAEMERIGRLFVALGINPAFPNLDPDALYQGMLTDKKIRNQRLRLILPQGIGNYFILEDASREEIIAAIREVQSQG